MFETKFSHISRGNISKSKTCFNLKFSAYHFHTKTKILADFQICISVPLNNLRNYFTTYKMLKTRLVILKILGKY